MFFRKKKKPIIFLHGILGSMGEAVFKGQGELHFGIAEIVYRPIIDDLRRLGYKEDRDLFICFYDWTKESMNSVEDYLLPMIKKVKEETGSPSVNLIGHSMGGIVARTYAQSNLYDNDVDKLIMIGTPNLGAASAYYFWSGGDLVSKDSYKNMLYKIVKNSFLWYIKFQYKKPIDMDFLREKIPSVKQLLPSDDYGDYLRLGDSNNYIDIEKMHARNEFLTELNGEKDILRERNIKIYNITGRAVETIKHISVRRQIKGKEKWKDGIPIVFIGTKKGDGTVISQSAVAIYGENIYIDSNHTDILSNCKDQLSRILGVDRGNVFRELFITSKEKEDEKTVIYSIISENLKEIDIIGQIDSYQVISRQKDRKVGCLLIKAKDNQDINLQVESLSDEGRLIVYKADTRTETIEEKNLNIKDIGVRSIKL